MKTHRFLLSALALLLLLLTAFSAAQAAPQARPPSSPAALGGGSWTRVWRSSGAVFDLACADAATCIAVGEKGLFLITRDSGVAWHQEILDGEPDLFGVSVNSRGLALAVGAQGAVFRTEDYGSAWEAATAPTQASLHDAWVLEDGRAWAVGDGGVILHSENGGRTWRTQASGVELPLYAVQFLDAQTGYAAGEKGTLLKTLDGGASWMPVANAFPGWARIRALHFTDADHGFIAGQAGHFYRTEDGGETWTTITVRQGDGALASDILSVHLQDGLGVLGGAKGVIATSQDGEHWTVQTAISQDARDVHAVLSQGGTDAWAAGAVKDADSAAFFISRSRDAIAFEPVVGDYGLHPMLHEAAAPSPDVAYIVGSGGAIAKTADGGETWQWRRIQSRFDAEAVITGVSCPTVDDCWIAGQAAHNPGFLYVTHDGGDSWQWQDPPGVQWPWLYDVEMVDGMHGQAAANPYMFYTEDGGATWRQSAVEGGTANVEIAMASLSEGWTAQRNLGHRFTTNGGKTWQRYMPYDEHAGLFFFGVEALDVNHDGGLDMGWLTGCEWIKSEERCVSNTGVVFFAAENQDPGYAQSLPPDTPPLYTITMLDARRGWIGGEGGALLYTDTGGAAWRAVEAPTAALITDIAFYQDKIGFAATYAGEILRFRGPGRNLDSFTQSTPISVDGDIVDWHVGGEFYLDAANAGAVLGNEPYPTPDQLSANLYSRWTEDTLYILAEIADDVVGAGDHLALALDGLNDDVWGHDDDILLSITADGDFDAGSPEANAAIAHAVGRSETGWIVELGVPASWLGRDALAPDASIGLNMALTDGDGPGAGHTLLLEDRRLLGDPAVWGAIRVTNNTLALQNGRQDYEGATDTFLTIWGEDGHTVHGNDESLQTIFGWGQDYSTILLRFDLPPFIDNVTVDRAQLALYVIASRTDANYRIGAFRLLRPWNPNAANWYQADAGASWGKAGALQPGVDYDPQALDILPISSNPHNAWLMWDVSDAVAYWRDHPDENYGILLKGLSDQRYITAYSSDYNGEPGQRPKLMVDFTLNPRPTPTPTPTPEQRMLYLPLFRK
ncbi:MAG TPA: DNRLRE domain-containing protein [Caldilineales bacterium]|nr:DNRLRE domain-containing protein [Caldilineales bacterium]